MSANDPKRTFANTKRINLRWAGDTPLSRRLLNLPGEERSYAAHGNAPVCSLWPVCRDFQILRAIPLGGEVFCWHSELLCQRDGNRFRATIRQGQIVYLRADC